MIICRIFLSLALISVVYCNSYDTTIRLLFDGNLNGRFDEFDCEIYGPLSSASTDACGGFARIKYLVDQIKNNNQNVFFFNTGDAVQGSAYTAEFGLDISKILLNEIGLDAWVLGNREFDEGPAALAGLLDALKFPTLGCNIDTSEEPALKDLIKKYIILNAKDEYGNDKKIGVIGTTYDQTPFVSNVGKLKILPVIPCLQQAVAELNNQGVYCIIAIGHNSYTTGIEIAQQVPGIQVVIEGNSFTKLCKDNIQQSIETCQGPYPTVVTQPSGDKVLVVHGFGYGKYLGDLTVTFKGYKCKLGEYSGDLILLNSTIPKDTCVQDLLEPYQTTVNQKGNQTVGYTCAYLNGSALECFLRDCSLGNFITDAFVDYNAKKYNCNNRQWWWGSWTDAPIAFTYAGNIRGSLRPGFITKGDLINVLPLENQIVKVTLKGVFLRQIMERSVLDYDPTGANLPPTFLQYSGIKVLFDFSRPQGHRVRQLWIRSCYWPDSYEPLDDCRTYGILMPAQLADGGVGYSMIKDNAQCRINLGATDTDIVEDYIGRTGTVTKPCSKRFFVINL